MSLMGRETHVINPKMTPLAQNAACIVIFQRYTIWVTQTAEQWVCMWGGGRGVKGAAWIFYMLRPLLNICFVMKGLSYQWYYTITQCSPGEKRHHKDLCGSILDTHLKEVSFKKVAGMLMHLLWPT